MQLLINTVIRGCPRWFASFLVLAALGGPALAAAPPRVGILRFHGKGETDVRVAVTQAVGTHGYALAGSKAIEDAARAANQPLVGRDGFATAAKSLGLAAVIEGRITSDGGVTTVRLGVHDASGAIVGAETWGLRRGKPAALARVVAKTFWKRLGPAVEKATGHRAPITPLVARSRRRRR
jgi:hypothetical protein